MPKIIETTVYEFSELNERAKEKARNWAREFCCSYDWWDCIYEDAANIGLKLTSFDLDRNLHAKGEFIESANICAAKIIAEHGEKCRTYKTAKEYEAACDALPEQITNLEEESRNCEAIDAIESEFLKSLLQDYAKLLKEQSEYLYSDESIDDMIESNAYTFLENGTRF